jgi:hypothetical protein
MDIHSIVGMFAGIPLDWLIAGTALVVMVLGTMLRGTIYPTALSLSLPVALILFNAASHTAFMGGIARQFSTPIEQVVLFAILTVIVFICMYRICTTFDHSSPPLVALVASLATVIIVIVFWIQITPLEFLWRPGAQMQSLFGDQYAFFWLIGAYLALAFARS